MKSSKALAWMMAAVAAVAITGCEWSTHDEDVQSYNDTGWQWVNFSGSYQKYSTDPVYHNVYQDKDIPDESQLSADLVVATATGPAIRVLTVHQKGQRLTITDNVGGTYKGTISDMRSAMGKMNYNDMNRVGDTNAIRLANGDVVVATFSASGRSGAGLQVTLTGTFQGEVMNDGQAFAKRTISGTWIETGGRGATIYGAAEPIVRYGYDDFSGSPLDTTTTRTNATPSWSADTSESSEGSESEDTNSTPSGSGDSSESGEGDGSEGRTLSVSSQSTRLTPQAPTQVFTAKGGTTYTWYFEENNGCATVEFDSESSSRATVTRVAAGNDVLVLEDLDNGAKLMISITCT